MNSGWNILFGLLVVVSSAVVTYAITLSRERLWLRSKKSEELYQKTEDFHFEISQFFSQRYDISQAIVFRHKSGDVKALNRQLVDLRVVVGLYFPTLGANLSAVLTATATAYDWLAHAEASDESNREHTLEALDFAVGGVKDSLEQFKAKILTEGRVDRIGKVSDILLNRSRRVQSERVLSVAT